MLVGYALGRPGSESLNQQIEALERAGCDKLVCAERSPNRYRLNRDLAAVVEKLHHGDTLVVIRLSCVAATVQDLNQFLLMLDNSGIKFSCLEQPVFNTDSVEPLAARATLTAIMEFQSEALRFSQQPGIQRAKQQGKYSGRKPSIDPLQISELLSQNVKPAAIAKRLSISPSSVYRLIQKDKLAKK